MYTPDVVIVILSLDVIVVVVATVVVKLLLDIGNGVAIVVLFFDVMEAIPTPDVSVMYSNNHAPSVLCTHLM